MLLPIKEKLRTIGFINTMRLIGGHLYSLAFRGKTLLFSADLSMCCPDRSVANTSLHVREVYALDGLSEGEHKDLLSYGGKRLEKAFTLLLDQRYRLFLGSLNGAMAGACWVRTGEDFKVEGVYLTSKDFLISRSFTIYRFRSQGVFSGIILSILTKMKNEGFERGYICCDESNVASQKGIMKAGFHYVDMGDVN